MEGPVSFQSTLARNLEFGHILEICAKAQLHGKCFDVTLAARTTNDADEANIKVGLHMWVYLNLNKIAFKTADNEWQQIRNDRFPTALFFQQFKINIVMSEKNFNISINGKSFARIPYAVAIDILNYVKITGDMEYIKQMDHRKYFPYTWPPLHLTDEKAFFSNDQPMSFAPGHVMIINAQLYGDAHGRLVLQIKNARDSTREELHVSAHFDIKKFIRNSKTVRRTDKHSGISYMDYSTEETGGGFPFRNYNPPFNLAIAFTANEFYIAKDGKFLYRFVYRTKNVLPDLVGVKLRGNKGAIVQVNSIDHIQMADPDCFGFEKYTELKQKN